MASDAESYYPPPAFHFRVSFAATGGQSDTSFQEVSGLVSEMETEPYQEGGENRFRHALPKGVTHPNLVLKRGIAKLESPLVIWCKAVLEGDLVLPVTPQSLLVMLLDEERSPLRSWSFSGAYPVKWEVGAFESTRNEVALETVELAYTSSYRLM